MEDYRVMRAIGKGSFGKVYLVRHERERKQYVMKVIRMKGIPKKERDACRNEVMLLQRLTHPAIVAYKDSFFAKGGEQLCIVMTYCDGGDLQGRINAARHKLFKEDQVMHWFVQIALGLHYMHANKVLHRDIKAQNIFLLGNGRLVLGDLGISKVLDGTMAFASTQIGTPYYMSPELFKNKPYNHKSDVWALGCVCYEMATLKHAFDAQSINGLASKIIRGSFPPIHSKYSSGLRRLIDRMLKVRPDDRPSLAAILTDNYTKRHIYNFIKDIADRSSSIGEGTAIFKAGAVQAAGGGGLGLAGLPSGPHSRAFFDQLRSLGLEGLVTKALNRDTVPAAVPPGPIDPKKARHVVRAQKNALSREEERKRAVEEALERLRKEKEDRAKKRAALQARQAHAAGVRGRHVDPRQRRAEERKRAAERRRPQQRPRRSAPTPNYGRGPPSVISSGGGGGGGGAPPSSRIAGPSSRPGLPSGRAGSVASNGSRASRGPRYSSAKEEAERRKVAELDRWDREQKRREDAAAKARDEAVKRERARFAAMEAEREKRREAERQQREASKEREKAKLEAAKLERQQRERRERELRAAEREAEKARAESARRAEAQRLREEAERKAKRRSSDPVIAAREAAEDEALRMRDLAMRQREEEERRRAAAEADTALRGGPPSKPLPSLDGGGYDKPPSRQPSARRMDSDGYSTPSHMGDHGTTTSSRGGPVVRDVFKRGGSHAMLPRSRSRDRGERGRSQDPGEGRLSARHHDPHRESAAELPRPRRLSGSPPADPSLRGRSREVSAHHLGDHHRAYSSNDVNGPYSPRTDGPSSEIVVGLNVATPDYQGMSARERVLARKMAARAAEDEKRKQQLAQAAQSAVADRLRAQQLEQEQYRGHNAAISSAVGSIPAARSPRQSRADPSALLGGPGGSGDGRPPVAALQLPTSRYDSHAGGGADPSVYDEDVRYSLGGQGSSSARRSSRSPRGHPQVPRVLPGELDDLDGESPSTPDEEIDGHEDGEDSEEGVVGEAGLVDTEDDLDDFESSGSGSDGGDDEHKHARPALGIPDDDDEIAAHEEELKAELARSTMRCSDLRAAVETAKKMIKAAPGIAGDALYEDPVDEDDDEGEEEEEEDYSDDDFDDDKFYQAAAERGAAGVDVGGGASSGARAGPGPEYGAGAGGYARRALPSPPPIRGGQGGGGYDAPGPADSPAPLVDRIRDIKRMCIDALGPAIFEEVYELLKARMWEAEALEVGGEAYDSHPTSGLKGILPDHQLPYAEKVQELLHMENAY